MSKFLIIETNNNGQETLCWVLSTKDKKEIRDIIERNFAGRIIIDSLANFRLISRTDGFSRISNSRIPLFIIPAYE